MNGTGGATSGGDGGSTGNGGSVGDASADGSDAASDDGLTDTSDIPIPVAPYAISRGRDNRSNDWLCFVLGMEYCSR